MGARPARRGHGGRAAARIDDLPGRVAESGTVPGRRLGVLVDHLVADRGGRIVDCTTRPCSSPPTPTLTSGRRCGPRRSGGMAGQAPAGCGWQATRPRARISLRTSCPFSRDLVSRSPPSGPFEQTDCDAGSEVSQSICSLKHVPSLLAAPRHHSWPPPADARLRGRPGYLSPGFRHRHGFCLVGPGLRGASCAARDRRFATGGHGQTTGSARYPPIWAADSSGGSNCQDAPNCQSA